MSDPRLPILAELEKKILWLASWTIHNANHIRENERRHEGRWTSGLVGVVRRRS
jgi:pyruvate dehydrogenase complex dehydrogenase (E1) component